jgi:coiled-coil domain-containing protein 77
MASSAGGAAPAPAPAGGSVAQLLAFYRDRFDAFEAERAEWLARVGAIEVAHSDLHCVKWELKVRQEEIAELQSALSDANVQLFEEREEALKLLAENDQLKLAQSEDRKRIQHLLALTEPVSEQVTFFKDCRPYLMTRKMAASQQQAAPYHPPAAHQQQLLLAAATGKPGPARVRGGEVQVVPNDKLRSSSRTTATASLVGAGSGSGSPAAQRIVRTIYLPNEQTEALAQRVEALDRLLADMSKASHERVAALERDRADKDQAARRAAKAHAAEVEALELKLEQAERACRAATKDYLDLRHATQVDNRGSMERGVALEQENADLKHQLATLADRLARETEAVRASIAEDGERHIERFRRQVLVTEDQHNRDKARFDKEMREAADKIEALSQRCVTLEGKYRAEKQRRQFDFEGFSNDLAEMRKQIRALEGAAVAHQLALIPVPAAASAAAPAAAPQAPAQQPQQPDKEPVRSEHLTHEQKMRNRAEQLRNSIEALRKSIETMDPTFAGQVEAEARAPSPRHHKPEWSDRFVVAAKEAARRR